MNQKETQLSICSKYGALFVDTPLDLIASISESVNQGKMPLNGLRHPVEGHATGWYIWAGEEFYEDANFFAPIHVKHVIERHPILYKYLGLPPGWRFLINDSGYEDVWLDDSLLNI